MSARDLISGEADIGTESDDESFDEDTGEPKSKRKANGTNGKSAHYDDSSEEEDDDDEEAVRAVGLATADHENKNTLLTSSMSRSKQIS